ncbi:StyC, styrene oxide isomerase, partial [Metarhizium majus ARSEF 297]
MTSPNPNPTNGLMAQDSLRRRMIGHGALMILAALLGGFGLYMHIMGGIEISPGRLITFNVPGTEAGWVRCHTGPVANGFMVIVTALGMVHLPVPEKAAKRIGWVVVMDGWSNVGFYFFGNLSPNRGLALGKTHVGDADVWSVLAFVPAVVFGFLVVGALSSRVAAITKNRPQSPGLSPFVVCERWA